MLITVVALFTSFDVNQYIYMNVMYALALQRHRDQLEIFK